MTGLCPTCRQWFALKGGRMRVHDDQRGARCWGSRERPEAADVAPCGDGRAEVETNYTDGISGRENGAEGFEESA